MNTNSLPHLVVSAVPSLPYLVVSAIHTLPYLVIHALLMYLLEFLQLLPHGCRLHPEAEVILLEIGGSYRNLVLLGTPGVPGPLRRLIVLTSTLPIRIVLKERTDDWSSVLKRATKTYRPLESCGTQIAEQLGWTRRQHCLHLHTPLWHTLISMISINNLTMLVWKESTNANSNSLTLESRSNCSRSERLKGFRLKTAYLDIIWKCAGSFSAECGTPGCQVGGQTSCGELIRGRRGRQRIRHRLATRYVMQIR